MAGLSSAHISPGINPPSDHREEGAAYLYLGGSLVTVRKPCIKTAQVGGGIRGLASFSRASRVRLMRKLAMIKRHDLPLFVTLTYPGEYSHDPKVWKNDLDKISKRLFRKFPSAGFIWKLEPQKRGAPHYHLLLWGIGYNEAIKWFSRAWFEVVRSGDSRHLAAGTRVERIKSIKGVFAYASKYLAKEIIPDNANDDTIKEVWLAGVGRYWGIRGLIPWAELVKVELGYQDAVNLFRVLRRLSSTVDSFHGKRIKLPDGSRPRSGYKRRATQAPTITVFTDAGLFFDRLMLLMRP